MYYIYAKIFFGGQVNYLCRLHIFKIRLKRAKIEILSSINTKTYLHKIHSTLCAHIRPTARVYDNMIFKLTRVAELASTEGADQLLTILMQKLMLTQLCSIRKLL